MNTINRPVTLIASRTRLPLRFFIILSLVLGLLANWQPQWSTGRLSRNAVLADNPPMENEITIPTPDSGTLLVAGGFDGFWFCETKTDKIGRITPSGVFTEFPLMPGTFPYAITLGPDGNMWFTGQNANIIGRITPSGAITTFPIPTPDSKPFGVTTAPDGNLWFTEGAAGKIGKITPSGSFTEFPLPLPGTFPFMICQGPGDGDVWFTEQAGNFVSRITPTGTITQFPIPTLNSSPSGITAGPDARLWFCENEASTIATVTRFGVFQEYPIPTPNSFPFSIVSPGDGNLYCTLQGASAIQPILPPFSPLPAFGSLIPTSEGPSGITFLRNASLSLRAGTSVFPAQGSTFHVGVVTEANRFGRFSPTENPPDCTVTLDKPEKSYNSHGRSPCVVTGHSNCKPKVSSEDTWILAPGGAPEDFFPDKMEFVVYFIILENEHAAPRYGEVKIGDKYFGVNQAGADVLPLITLINLRPTSTPSGGPGFKLTVNPGGSSESAITIQAAGFTATSIVGWDGEERPTALVGATELSADISADDIATPGTVQVTVFDPSPSGGTSPDSTFTITAAPDFAIGFDSSTVTTQAGTKARVTVNIIRTGGFSGNVTVTPPPAANGIRPKPPDPITAAPTDTGVVFKFKVGGGVAAGQYPLTFTAQDDSGRTRTATVMLVVQ